MLDAFYRMSRSTYKWRLLLAKSCYMWGRYSYQAQRHPPSLHQTSGNTWFVQEDCINITRDVKSATIVTAIQKGKLCSHSTVSNLGFTSSYLLSLQAVAALAEELWCSPHLFPHTSGTSKSRIINCKVATAAGNTNQAHQ